MRASSPLALIFACCAALALGGAPPEARGQARPAPRPSAPAAASKPSQSPAAPAKPFPAPGGSAPSGSAVPSNGASAAKAAPLPPVGQQVCIKAPRANLRAGPGAKFRVTWEVNRYMPLLQVTKEGEWIKVRDVDGDLHWVSDKVVTGQQDCVTVKAERANIRKAPSSKADTWFTVEKYTSFHRIGQKDNWVKIEYEGETMWVAQALVWPT